MDDGYVGDDDYVRMLVLLATIMVIMIMARNRDDREWYARLTALVKKPVLGITW